MEDQRRDIGKGVWFGALMFYALIFSILGQSEPSMTLRVSPNMTVQQEGTTVSLLCQVSGLSTSTHFLFWAKEPSSLLIATNKDLNVSDERYHVSFTEGAISTFNLTISQVETTDSGTYECNLIMRIDETRSRRVLEEELDLLVYPRDAFPSCSPHGPAAIDIGSQISCTTSGIATPSINGENDDWTYYSGVKFGNRAILSKTVTSSDNSQTYVCVAEIPDSDTRLSCTIGPLTVVSVDSASTVLTTAAVTRTVTTDTDTQTSTQVPTACPCDVNHLSPVGIAGVAGGVLVILVTIVVNLLCCRYDPSRWQQLKTKKSSGNVDTNNLNIRSELQNNKQDGTEQHSYANVVVDTEPSSQLEGETSFICSDQSLSQGGVKSTRGLLSNRPDGQDKDTSSRQADPYMELNIVDQKPALYTELKL